MGVNERDGIVIISTDTAFKGALRNCKRLEIFGYVEGEVTTGELIVHDGGNFYGQAQTDTANISGTMQGDIVVGGLIKIHSTGVVAGNVHYGRLAMDTGGHLWAEVRNVPPRIMGDFQISVVRGRTVRVTTQDINAVDPDDKATDLVFTVSNAANGKVAVTGGSGRPQGQFTQADLAGGRVVFQHDGSSANDASFDAVVADKSGATSGASQTVKVTVRTA